MNDDRRRALDRIAAGLPASTAELALHQQRNLIANPLDQMGTRLVEDAQRHQTLMKDILEPSALSLVGKNALAQVLENAERQRRLIEGPIEQARKLGLLNPQSDLNTAIKASMQAQADYEKLFRLPLQTELAQLSAAAAKATEIARFAYGAPGVGASLQAAMAGMRHPYLELEDVTGSARAFAEMQAMGQALKLHAPFEDPLGISLRSVLGDWRDPLRPEPNLWLDLNGRLSFYQARGFDVGVTRFSEAAFDESAVAAGVAAPAAPADAADLDAEGYSLARDAFADLQTFEITLRRFIARVMHAAFGETWMKRQLPAGMREGWEAKKATALKAGEAERPLIDYADFSDYRLIIERGDNWKTVFKPIFGRPEDVRESLQRLYPLRIATMHARIITSDDRLLLMVETKRVMEAVSPQL